jgi:hypothetical protein
MAGIDFLTLSPQWARVRIGHQGNCSFRRPARLRLWQEHSSEIVQRSGESRMWRQHRDLKSVQTDREHRRPVVAGKASTNPSRPSRPFQSTDT